MAKKILIPFLCSFFYLSISAEAMEIKEAKPSAVKQVYDPEMDCTKQMKLNSFQRKQLDIIYQRIYHDYSELIKVYSGAGALTPYQTKVRFNMLNNYIKTFYLRDYRWCSEHEADEWEEEWFNSDND